jgi:hypothetical protein
MVLALENTDSPSAPAAAGSRMGFLPLFFTVMVVVVEVEVEVRRCWRIWGGEEVQTPSGIIICQPLTVLIIISNGEKERKIPRNFIILFSFVLVSMEMELELEM